ncbi:hypothetical protein E4K46_06120, partial [Neisseria meningitidis]|nr:hypothetical protein [Neisseria meningitidis]
FLRTVEWLGNMLPHPVTLFIIFIVLLLIASAAGFFGLPPFMRITMWAFSVLIYYGYIHIRLF